MEELWIGFLALWIAAGRLAAGLAGAGWEAGWPRGPPGAEATRPEVVNGRFWGPRTSTFIKKPTTNPTLDQGHQTPETRTRD